MKEYYDTILVVYLHEEQCHGTVENMGAFASIVKYNKDGETYEDLLENEEFTVLNEIVFKHIEEQE